MKTVLFVHNKLVVWESRRSEWKVLLLAVVVMSSQLFFSVLHQSQKWYSVNIESKKVNFQIFKFPRLIWNFFVRLEMELLFASYCSTRLVIEKQTIWGEWSVQSLVSGGRSQETPTTNQDWLHIASFSLRRVDLTQAFFLREKRFEK